ncbi:hypothetical protein EZV62_016973 [Acer yangbiense]|uniref:Uncharacterized protein n=1 Tax=Acer yangbiense TaxID=1000413 RepID=A0A5C7HQL6_9ROSI|nr:hypothetical protein EZV62_016973 [Acer yangbiense]
MSVKWQTENVDLETRDCLRVGTLQRENVRLQLCSETEEERKKIAEIQKRHFEWELFNVRLLKETMVKAGGEHYKDDLCYLKFGGEAGLQPELKCYQTQKAKSEVPAVKEGKKAPLLTDYRTFPVLAFMAYIGPFPCVEPANRTPLANVRGPKASALLGSAIDHIIFPFRTSIATHPQEVVVLLDGLRLKYLPAELTIMSKGGDSNGIELLFTHISLSSYFGDLSLDSSWVDVGPLAVHHLVSDDVMYNRQ